MERLYYIAIIIDMVAVILSVMAITESFCMNVIDKGLYNRILIVYTQSVFVFRCSTILLSCGNMIMYGGISNVIVVTVRTVLLIIMGFTSLIASSTVGSAYDVARCEELKYVGRAFTAVEISLNLISKSLAYYILLHDCRPDPAENANVIDNDLLENTLITSTRAVEENCAICFEPDNLFHFPCCFSIHYHRKCLQDFYTGAIDSRIRCTICRTIYVRSLGLN